MPAITVVTPTIGRHTELRRVLDGLAAQTAQEFELIVVCDAAHPDPERTEALAEGLPYPARVLRATRPGASAARNAAIESGASDLVLFLDDDVVPQPQLVAEHLEAHRRNPAREVAVLGRVVWAPELRVTPFMRWVGRGMQFDYEAIVGEQATWAQFYTANASAKKAVVAAVGGFDETGLPYGYEDLDLAKRMHDEHGLRVFYARNAVGEHLHEMTLESWRGNVARIAPTERVFVAKHPEIEPYFYDLFIAASQRSPASGRGRHLTWLFRKPHGRLGKRVWGSADIWYRQQLAPHFLAAWDAAAGEPAAAEGSTTT